MPGGLAPAARSDPLKENPMADDIEPTKDGKPSRNRRGGAKKGIRALSPLALEGARGAKDADPAPDEFPFDGPHESRLVRLDSGGVVQLNIAVNWFDVDDNDRVFLLTLIDLVRSYTAGVDFTQGLEDMDDVEDDGLDEPH